MMKQSREDLVRLNWCEWRDSNSQGLPHWNLNPARLPISPHSHVEFRWIILALQHFAEVD